MLRDTITYGAQRILTVYHDNEELDVPARQWQEKEKVGRYWLEFEEVSGNFQEELPAQDTFTEHALLSYNHPLSPCDDHQFCVAMTRHRSTNKPSRIFLSNNTGIRLKPEVWNSLCEFVKNHTGIDLSKSPMALGDTFQFHYIQLCYHETKEGTILVQPFHFDRIDIHFKRKSEICEAKSCHLDPTTQAEIEFVPTEEWDAFDIFAYDEDQLWFYAQDVHFMRVLHMTMNFGGTHSVPLKKSNYCAEYTNPGSRRVLTIGEERGSLRLSQEQQEAKLLAILAQRSKTAYLIQKGDDRIVYNIANKLLNQQWDEVQLFDPYLLDQKGKAALIDWMRMLCGCSARSIHAIYYRRAEDKEGKNLSLAEAKVWVSKDWGLSQLLLRNASSVHLIGLNEYIHDRFLLCRRASQFAGISFGTSLNSLGSNYFCVHSLPSTLAQECWEVFDFLIASHTEENEVIRHG